MKPAHRLDLFAWSRYQEPLHLAFNGSRWARAAGNVLEGHGAHAEQLRDRRREAGQILLHAL